MMRSIPAFGSFWPAFGFAVVVMIAACVGSANTSLKDFPTAKLLQDDFYNQRFGSLYKAEDFMDVSSSTALPVAQKFQMRQAPLGVAAPHQQNAAEIKRALEVPNIEDSEARDLPLLSSLKGLKGNRHRLRVSSTPKYSTAAEVFTFRPAVSRSYAGIKGIQGNGPLYQPTTVRAYTTLADEFSTPLLSPTTENMRVGVKGIKGVKGAHGRSRLHALGTSSLPPFLPREATSTLAPIPAFLPLLTQRTNLGVKNLNGVKGGKGVKRGRGLHRLTAPSVSSVFPGSSTTIAPVMTFGPYLISQRTRHGVKGLKGHPHRDSTEHYIAEKLTTMMVDPESTSGYNSDILSKVSVIPGNERSTVSPIEWRAYTTSVPTFVSQVKGNVMAKGQKGRRNLKGGGIPVYQSGVKSLRQQLFSDSIVTTPSPYTMDYTTIRSYNPRILNLPNIITFENDRVTARSVLNENIQTIVPITKQPRPGTTPSSFYPTELPIIQEGELSEIQQTELPVQQTELPVQQTELPVQQTELPFVQQTEIPVMQQTEFPEIQQTIMPQRETEATTPHYVVPTTLNYQQTESYLQQTQEPFQVIQSTTQQPFREVQSTQLPIEQLTLIPDEDLQYTQGIKESTERHLLPTTVATIEDLQGTQAPIMTTENWQEADMQQETQHPEFTIYTTPQPTTVRDEFYRYDLGQKGRHQLKGSSKGKGKTKGRKQAPKVREVDQEWSSSTPKIQVQNIGGIGLQPNHVISQTDPATPLLPSLRGYLRDIRMPHWDKVA